MEKNNGCREEDGEDEDGVDEMQLINKWCR